MNDIPRGTPKMRLVNYLLAPPHWPGEAATPADTHQPQVQFACNITDSRLDDELSVATIEFTRTPKWLHLLNLDPTGFPKKTLLGTLWRGVDTSALDSDGRTEFVRAATADNLLYAEALAEFPTTDINVQDVHGRTALHWASANSLPNIVMLCLSVPGCNVGLRDRDNLTAFDLGLRGKDDVIPNLFYNSMFELEERDPQAALLRVLTVSSAPVEGKPVFPGVAMFAPAQARNLALVEALVDRGVDLTATNSEGETALHVAAAQVGNADVVRRLLEAGADVDATATGGATALNHAADEETVQALQQWRAELATSDTKHKEAHPSTGGPNGKTMQTEMPITEEVETRYDYGRTALHLRAKDGDLSAVLDLIARGADLKSVDRYQQTALHFATKGGYTEIVTALLTNGADIEATDLSDHTALHLTVCYPHTEVLTVLLARGANIHAVGKYGRTALQFAAMSGQVEAVTALLANGANIEAADQGGGSALRLGTQNRHTEIVTTLLTNGADVNAADNRGSTALHLAVQNRHAEMVTILLSNGADTNAADLDGQRVLHNATKNGCTEIVTALLTNGADIDATDSHGFTALHLAARDGRTEIVATLLTQGANVAPAAATNGWRALHFAADGGHFDIVTVLLANGAKVEAKANDQRTALHLAILSTHLETVETLLDHGASATARASIGTPLQLALRNQDSELAQIFLTHQTKTSRTRRLLHQLGLDG